MAKNTDLLRWVLSGVLALSAVAATAVVSADSTTGTAPGSSTALPSPPPPARPTVTAEVSPVVVSPKARSPLPPGQVWECMIDGQRVFSDTQCGAHASVRQLSEPNVMDSTALPAHGAPRPYGHDPGPAADYYPPSQPASDEGMDEPEGSDPVYSAPAVIVVREHRRRNHDPHHAHHHYPRAARP